ncbi:hypothetical protein [Sedimentibacter sp. B4]|uniref:hypothetical protein n=1 Tax=Sedimentibacter sp. B4 TaxID=304766 RepID=UPI00031D9F6D|nr:hypothetical protein [Sedimentibacter sp. B4]
MKKILMMLIVFVYFVPISLFISFYLISTQNLQGSSTLAALSMPFVFMLVVCGIVIINIVGAMRSVVQQQCLSFRTVMVFKLWLIPFYIVNFACWVLASAVFHIAIIVWPIIPFIIAYTYFSMLGTSAHIIAKLTVLRRSKKITAKQFAIHCIFQIVFAVDVIDSIYLAKKQKKFEPTLELQ